MLVINLISKLESDCFL